MADVRLTATNPEDSSVVAVACDASGRLLLEEQGQGPQGEQGIPGPKGEDGDPFSGNFADDVTFGGSATVAEYVVVPNPAATNRCAMTDTGISAVRDTADAGKKVWSAFGGSNETSIIYSDGSATFSEGVLSNKFFRVESTDDVFAPYRITNEAGEVTFDVSAGGSASFAGNKAGFTAEGYLWCTTVRGDTVMLDATSNGMGVWTEYTPNTRIDEIRDRLDANRGDTGEMPADTP
jgi:hypothetical protein